MAKFTEGETVYVTYPTSYRLNTHQATFVRYNEDSTATVIAGINRERVVNPKWLARSK